jgi:hypothetical protein
MVELAGTDVALTLQEEARRIGCQLFGADSGKGARFAEQLMAIYHDAQDKDFLLIHNPGGWGNSPLENCLHWEKSVVVGISATLEKLGYRLSFSQHFRGGSGWREHLRDVILIGISQGAGFSNAVMQRLSELKRVYSIELGVFFYYRPRRVLTERTLAIDSNGLTPDAVIEGDLLTMLMTLPAACFRWVNYRLRGRKVKFSRCIKLAGHDYHWEYPRVGQQIGDFLKLNFGAKP